MTIVDRISQFENHVVSNYVSAEFKTYLSDHGFFEAPASTQHHGCYAGGLFDHSFKVMEILVQLTKDCDLRWSREESPYLVGMFHDLCKIDQYIVDFMTNDTKDGVPQFKYKWNDEQSIIGYGSKSVILLSQFMALTEEEIACIMYHMRPFSDKSEWSTYLKAVNRYSNVLWTHHSDMIVSQVMNI